MKMKCGCYDYTALKALYPPLLKIYLYRTVGEVLFSEEKAS